MSIVRWNAKQAKYTERREINFNWIQILVQLSMLFWKCVQWTLNKCVQKVKNIMEKKMNQIDIELSGYCWCACVSMLDAYKRSIQSTENQSHAHFKTIENDSSDEREWISASTFWIQWNICAVEWKCKSINFRLAMMAFLLFSENFFFFFALIYFCFVYFSLQWESIVSRLTNSIKW